MTNTVEQSNEAAKTPAQGAPTQPSQQNQGDGKPGADKQQQQQKK